MMVFINLGFAGLMTGMTLNLVNGGTAPVKVGLINTAMGISAILGSLVATRLVDRIPTGRLLPSVSLAGAVTNLANIFAAFSAAIAGWLLTVSSPAVCAAAFWAWVVIATVVVCSSTMLKEIPTPHRWDEFPL